MQARIKASEALSRTKTAVAHKADAPKIRASELVQRRHAKAVADMAKAIEQRERAFAALVRVHRKIWMLARQVQRYESIVPIKRRDTKPRA
jgi:phage antirepressor YoqD-like protein